MDRGQLRARVDRDSFVVREALGQVARHCVVAADQDVDLAGMPVQEEGGLAGRVGAAHDHAGEECPLTHQHAQLADDVAFLDHEHDPAVPAVQK